VTLWNDESLRDDEDVRFLARMLWQCFWVWPLLATLMLHL